MKKFQTVMPNRAASEEIDWLNTNPRLEELIERYPAIWETAGKEIIEAGQTGRSQRLNEAAIKAKNSAEAWKTRIAKSRSNPKVIESALPQIIKSRMVILALDKGYLAAAAGKTTGKVRFTLWNGLILQKLLFERHFTRKPVALGWFRFWWFFVTQKKLLMPLVQDQGIYCFYTKELIREIGALAAGRPCLEIGAGDGTLARFLSASGVQVIATDDLSWKHAIEYPENVQNLNAKQALQKYDPSVVICSWPPAGNDFERHVFSSKNVQLYIVIGSRYKFVSGNWETYNSQDKFDWAVDEELSKLVLPPNAGNAVLIFRRK